MLKKSIYITYILYDYILILRQNLRQNDYQCI